MSVACIRTTGDEGHVFQVRQCRLNIGAPTAADWSTEWATDAVRAARRAFVGVRFGVKHAGRWPARLPSGYSARINDVKREQVVKAGARLAQLLQAVWP